MFELDLTYSPCCLMASAEKIAELLIVGGVITLSLRCPIKSDVCKMHHMTLFATCPT